MLQTTLIAMNYTYHHRKSANEKGIEELQFEAQQWERHFQEISDEINFFKVFLTGDVFQNNVPNLFERLQEYYNDLMELKTQKMALHEELRNHKNDLNGMMECEDISCENFYYTQHHKLGITIEKHKNTFRQLELNIFKFTTPLLRRNE